MKTFIMIVFVLSLFISGCFDRMLMNPANIQNIEECIKEQKSNPNYECYVAIHDKHGEYSLEIHSCVCTSVKVIK